MSRTSILRGPCKMTFNSIVFYSKGDVKITHAIGTYPIPTSRFGVVGWHVDSVKDVIEFEPDGRFASAALATYLPFNTKTIGSSVLGANTSLTINSVDGNQRVYVAAANTTRKQVLRLSSRATVFGPMQFTALYGGANAPSDSGSLFADSSVSYPGDTGYDRTAIVTQPYSIAWGSSPFDAFVSKDGITIEIDVDMQEETSESHGIYDYIFAGMQVSAKFQPDGPTVAQVLTPLKLQGSGATLGRDIGTTDNLNISASGVYVRLYNAGIVSGEEFFSGKLRRQGTVEFRASRTVTTGTLDPLIYVGASAPA